MQREFAPGGVATALYGDQNKGKLPFAYIYYSDQKQTTWDTLLGPTMRAAMRGDKMNAPAPSQKEANKALLCPADILPPPAWAVKFNYDCRTYSMGYHNMEANNWPPGPDNATGVGLHWKAGAPGNQALPAQAGNPGGPSALPFITRDVIPEPKKTLLLTERVRVGNVSANMAGAVIANTADHMETNAIPAEKFHKGMYNYLMVDGHVETMYPVQTVGIGGEEGNRASTHHGIWTIKAGD